MKRFSFVLFCLSFSAFCVAAGFCVLLFLFPYGLFRPAIICETKTLDLGTINSDTDIDCRFTIKNLGNRPLHFRDIVPACGSGNTIQIVDAVLEPLPPHQERVFCIRFHPYHMQGRKNTRAVISSDDPQFPHYVLSITAEVKHIPPPSVTPKLAPIVH